VSSIDGPDPRPTISLEQEITVYKTLIRTQIKRDIRALNRGDATFLLRRAAPDAELSFPGDNSWSRQFRAVSKGPGASVTHRGRAELDAFAQEFVARRLGLEVEDIVINGPPWRTRICVRAVDHAEDEHGREVYVNRVVAFIETRWGKVHRWEDYLDTERVRAWDDRITASATTAPAGEPVRGRL